MDWSRQNEVGSPACLKVTDTVLLESEGLTQLTQKPTIKHNLEFSHPPSILTTFPSQVSKCYQTHLFFGLTIGK
jgi:hypothetical protein